jgi:serine/threonine-protein kinase
MNPADPFGLVGQVLDGQFRVEKLVGEGGFSTVYRGHNVGLNEPVAIKCLKLPPTLGTALVDTFIQRFRDESRILYRLSQGNLNVVRSVGAGTTQSPLTGALVPYMALEWLEGRSLANDFVVRKASGAKGRPLDEVVRLFETAADALGFAHAQGVVHRDLNPGNLFLVSTPKGQRMKVLDFGVAKLMDDSLGLGPRAATVGQIRIFAPAYGAPEQYDDKLGPIGAASDVYAFALILLEALRDQAVNEGEHLGDFVHAATDANRRPTPRLLGLDVPDEIEQTFARATTLDPRQRWQSVTEFWQALTIGLKVATERRYEKAARETPSLDIGAAKKQGTLAMPGAPALGRTMALGGAPPRPAAAAPRPGSSPAIPAPQARPQSAPAIPVPQARPQSAPAIPARPPVPAAGAKPPEKRPGTERMPPAAPAAKAVPADTKSEPTIVNPPAPTPPSAPPPVDDDEEETKIRAPSAEMLRTLAMNDPAAIQARDAAMRAAGVKPPSSPIKAAVPAPRPAAGTPAPAPPDALPPESEPHPADEGGTLMMARAPVRLGPDQPSPVGGTLMFGSGATPPPPAGHGQTVLHNPAAQQAAQAAVHAAQQQQQHASAQGAPPQPWDRPTANPGGAPPIAPGASQVIAPHGQAPAPFMPSPYAARPAEQAPPAPPFGAPAQPEKKLPILPIAIGLGVVALVGGGLGIFALASGGKSKSTAAASASASMSATVEPIASATPPPVATDPPTAVETDASAAEATAEASDASATDTADAGAAAAATATATATTTATATATAATATATAPAWTPPATPPTATMTAIPKASADPNAWNEGAARARLAQANAVLVICKKEGGVSGPGNATVTFNPDGSVAAVSVDPPYAGTKEGECAANQFRRAKINAFNGSQQTLRHAFEVPK